MRSINRFLPTLAATLSFTTGAFAATYTEQNNGDLSGDRTNPTTFNLAMGDNTLTATTVLNDEDYVKIVVPAMHNLAKITLTAYDGANTKSFIAFQSGNTFTETVAAPDPTKMLGYCHFGTSGTAQVVVNGDVLAAMKNGIAGFGAPIGYTPPLAAGNYTFWLHETANAQPRTYTLTFTVQANAAVQAAVLTPGSGTYTDSVTVDMSTTTPNATIYFTIDGSTPTTSSTAYFGAFPVSQSLTIKTLAHDNNNVLSDSVVTSEVYTIVKTPPPTVDVTGKSSITTTKPVVKLKGTAANATSVKYKIDKGPFKTATGTSAWSIKAKLKPGKHVITIQVTGKNGTTTSKVTVTVKKKK